MKRKTRRIPVQVLLAGGLLMFVIGCQSSVGSATASNDFSTFVQQFAREALAALLF